ncbi:unnamed protein product [Phaeothamnion confervicola]
MRLAPCTLRLAPLAAGIAAFSVQPGARCHVKRWHSFGAQNLDGGAHLAAASVATPAQSSADYLAGLSPASSRPSEVFDGQLTAQILASAALGTASLLAFLIAGLKLLMALPLPTLLTEACTYIIAGAMSFKAGSFVPFRREKPRTAGFYAALRRPRWAPPAAAGRAASAAVRALWATAAGLAFSHVGSASALTGLGLPPAIVLFAAQLSLTEVWFAVAFRECRLGPALTAAAAAWAATLAAARALHRVAPLAGWLYLPSCVVGAVLVALGAMLRADNGGEKLYPVKSAEAAAEAASE